MSSPLEASFFSDGLSQSLNENVNQGAMVGVCSSVNGLESLWTIAWVYDL